MDFARVFETLLLLASLSVSRSELYTVRKSKAQPRTLTFLETAPTRVQFIGGIGIPVEDLNFESITSGYVLKAEYFLPTKAEEFTPNYLKPQTIHRRSANETLFNALQLQNATSTSRSPWNADAANKSSRFGDNFKSKQQNASVYRWLLYRAIELLMNSAGLSGRVCMLRSICEHAALPLYYDSGILAEILHIILTPSTSRDELVKAANRDYINAEVLGYTGGNCEEKFSACIKSPIDQISAIFDL